MKSRIWLATLGAVAVLVVGGVIVWMMVGQGSTEAAEVTADGAVAVGGVSAVQNASVGGLGAGGDGSGGSDGGDSVKSSTDIGSGEAGTEATEAGIKIGEYTLEYGTYVGEGVELVLAAEGMAELAEENSADDGGADVAGGGATELSYQIDKFDFGGGEGMELKDALLFYTAEGEIKMALYPSGDGAMRGNVGELVLRR